MDKKNIKIGIWGFGSVGQAATRYFVEKGYTVAVMDNRTLTTQEIQELKHNNIRFYHEQDKVRFFSFNDFLLSSPGVNISKDYATYSDKWVTELDLFYTAFHKPIIAITGSVGKTTITYLLSETLKHFGLTVATGGNIGTPTFALINQQNMCSAAILEVSSFQLENSKQFAPNLAVITNFHPNHIDRHNNKQQYLKAKLNILAYQEPHQYALVPLSLRKVITTTIQLKQRCAFFSTYRPSDNALQGINHTNVLYYVDNNRIMQYGNGSHKKLINLTTLPSCTFTENWLILCSILTMMKIPLTSLVHSTQHITLPEHRLEHVATINLVDFYNDSKSTIPASTLAAVDKLVGRPILLFLGGLSKGIDRAHFIKNLKSNIQEAFCFGDEAKVLEYMCLQNNISASQFKNLQIAFARCTQIIKPGNQILFSPAGSSFDLYANYQERGNHFKELVYAYKEKIR